MIWLKIIITGASGSGTTTLARALSQELGCQIFDSDDYFWEPTAPPYQIVRAKENRLKLLAESGVPQALAGLCAFRFHLRVGTTA